MKTNELLIKIADLLLISDDATSDWVKVPILRALWFMFCVSISLLILLVIIRNFWLDQILLVSETATFYYRLTGLIVLVLNQIVIIAITVNYFKYILQKGAPIRLSNVIFFYLISTVFFSYLYMVIWRIFPSMFIYISPPLQTSKVAVNDLWGEYIARWDFIAFSSLHSVGSSYYKIQYNSIITSFIGWVHAIYNLSLVTLLIASYVNQKIGLQHVESDHKSAEHL